MTKIKPDWIALDWVTAHLRATAMGAAGPLAQKEDGCADGFEPALNRLIGPWLTVGVTPVIACGTVAARQGWADIHRRQVPCAPLEPGLMTAIKTTDPRISLQMSPGLSQINPADVMQGEETLIAGALALDPQFDGVICLPGTHLAGAVAKWAHISAGEVVSFQSFLTAELFAFLSQQSTLAVAADGFDENAFDVALSDGLSRPDKLGARLFSLRAEGLLAGLEPITARSRLWGLLIGMELAAAKPYWLGQPVILIGAPGLCDLYASALMQQGITPVRRDAGDCTLAGLSKLKGAL